VKIIYLRIKQQATNLRQVMRCFKYLPGIQMPFEKRFSFQIIFQFLLIIVGSPEDKFDRVRILDTHLDVQSQWSAPKLISTREKQSSVSKLFNAFQLLEVCVWGGGGLDKENELMVI
jgi:hypothetical protein